MRPTIDQILQNIKLAPIPPEEVELANHLEPGDYEIYSEKLNNIADEAKQVYTRSGLSYFLRSGDMVISTSNSRGDVVFGYCGINHGLPIIPGVIKYILANYRDDPTVGIRDGDIFFANDGLYGASHNPDMVVLMPMFYEGELIAWGSAGVHEPDCGSMDPGGMSAAAKNRYMEGIHIPPMKIGENFQLRSDWMEFYLNATRVPLMHKVDTGAKISGCMTFRKRLFEIAAEKGKDFLKGLFTKMLLETEAKARRRIASWNDGVYRSIVFSDLGGTTPALIRVFVSMIKKGDEVTFDFEGTSPENQGAFHGTVALNVGYLCMQAFAYYFHDLPVSNAALTPFNWKFPAGCVLNPHPEAAVAMGTLFNGTLITALPQAIYKAMFDSPDRDIVGAPDGPVGNGEVIAGVNQWDFPFSESPSRVINGHGQGARMFKDGMNMFGCSFGPSAGRQSDAEDEEDLMPVLVLWDRMSPDSFGHGKFRGGACDEHSYAVHGVDHVVWVPLNLGGSCVPHSQGLFGGYPPPAGALVVVKTNVDEAMARGERIPTSLRELVTERPLKGEYIVRDLFLPPGPIMRGWLWAFRNGLSAGYGDCLERDPELALQDVRTGIMSAWAAKNVYKVVLDSENSEVDVAETEKLRAQERKNRIARGKTYDEFMTTWRDRKPPENALNLYGTWPDAKQDKKIIRF